MDTASRSLVLTEEWLSASKDSELDESQHSWEAPLAFTWSSVLQDQDGQLISDTKDKQRESRRIRMVKEKDALKAAKVERGMVRFLVLVVDMSTAMEMKDLKPSRKLLACEAIEKFVAEFFDQNPISKLGIVVAKNRRATRLTELSGNPKQQVELLRNAMEEHASGEFSLQNALQTAKKSLEQMPDYGSREMILVTGSLTSCDPGDIFQTFQEVKSSRIQCSFISLSAEVYVFKALAELTKGSFAVVFNEKHLDALLAERVPPSLTDMELHRNRVRRWIHMGFPKMISETYPSLCACHSDWTYKGYLCPVCNAKMCEIPGACKICGLTLVSSSHLARSYHHLFPVKSFVEWDVSSSSTDGQVVDCFACGELLSHKEDLVVQCEQCSCLFCVQCDEFIHTVLFNCPGCLTNSNSGQIS